MMKTTSHDPGNQSIDLLFDQMRQADPVVTFSQTRALVEAHAPLADELRQTEQINQQRSKRRTIMISSLTGILLLGITLATTGLLQHRGASPTIPVRADENGMSTKPSVEQNQSLVPTFSPTSEQTSPTPVQGKKPEGNEKGTRPANEQDGTEKTLRPKLNPLELTFEELGALGLQPDSNGVWMFYPNYAGMHIGSDATRYEPDSRSIIAKTTRVGSFTATHVTEDLGAFRMTSSTDDLVEPDSYLHRQDSVLSLHEEGIIDDQQLDSLMKVLWNQELEERKAEIASGSLIPIAARATVERTEPVDGSGWRSSLLFWYHPSSDFINLLPSRYQDQVKRYMRLRALMQEKPANEPVEAYLDRQPKELKEELGLAGTTDEATSGTEMLSMMGYSTVISSSNIYPNPAQNDVQLTYNLTSSRRVSVGLYNPEGELIRTIKEPAVEVATIQMMSFSVKDLPNGIYLVVISTGKEYVTQRLVVKK